MCESNSIIDLNERLKKSIYDYLSIRPNVTVLDVYQPLIADAPQRVVGVGEIDGKFIEIKPLMRAYIGSSLPTYIDVKSDKNEQLIEEIKERLKTRGYGYWCFSQEDISEQVLVNISFLGKYKNPPSSAEPYHYTAILDKVSEMGVTTIGYLMALFFPGNKGEFGVSVICHLIAKHRLNFDFYKPISDMTEVWPKNDKRPLQKPDMLLRHLGINQVEKNLSTTKGVGWFDNSIFERIHPFRKGNIYHYLNDDCECYQLVEHLDQHYVMVRNIRNNEFKRVLKKYLSDSDKSYHARDLVDSVGNTAWHKSQVKIEAIMPLIQENKLESEYYLSRLSAHLNIPTYALIYWTILSKNNNNLVQDADVAYVMPNDIKFMASLVAQREYKINPLAQPSVLYKHISHFCHLHEIKPPSRNAFYEWLADEYIQPKVKLMANIPVVQSTLLRRKKYGLIGELYGQQCCINAKNIVSVMTIKPQSKNLFKEYIKLHGGYKVNLFDGKLIMPIQFTTIEKSDASSCSDVYSKLLDVFGFPYKKKAMDVEYLKDTLADLCITYGTRQLIVYFDFNYNDMDKKLMNELKNEMRNLRKFLTDLYSVVFVFNDEHQLAKIVKICGDE